MRSLHRLSLPAVYRALAATATCLVCACATSTTPRPGKLEVQDDSGFTISDPVRVSSRVRGDFEEALRLIEDEQYEGGIALLEAVTEAAPDATTPHINLGIAHRLAGDLEGAEASIARALELNARHPVAHNEMGIVQRKQGRFEEARESYEQALAIFPGFHFARRNLAVLCDVYLSDMACAIEHYRLYAEVVPEDDQVGIWINDLQNRIEKAER